MVGGCILGRSGGRSEAWLLGIFQGKRPVCQPSACLLHPPSSSHQSGPLGTLRLRRVQASWEEKGNGVLPSAHLWCLLHLRSPQGKYLSLFVSIFTPSSVLIPSPSSSNSTPPLVSIYLYRICLPTSATSIYPFLSPLLFLPDLSPSSLSPSHLSSIFLPIHHPSSHPLIHPSTYHRNTDLVKCH